MPSGPDLAPFAAEYLSWAISALAVGGGQMVTPVVTLASLTASPTLIILFFR